MNLKLKIIEILQPTSYINKQGDTAYIYYAVGETLDAYPRKVKFDVFGDERWTRMNLLVGQIYDFQIEVNSREWNGKWFTNIIAQGLEYEASAPQIPVQQQIQPQVAQQTQWNTTATNKTILTGSNDLPF